MFEVELKARLSEAHQIEEQLIEIGFLLIKEVYERDCYFNAPDRDFALTDEALRLRHVTDASGENSALLTYKGPKRGEGIKSRIEHEANLCDPATIESILLALHYKRVLEVKKKRLYYISGEFTVTIDYVEGLGKFIEIELQASNEVEECAAIEKINALGAKLSIQKNSYITKSYLEQLLELNNK